MPPPKTKTKPSRLRETTAVLDEFETVPKRIVDVAPLPFWQRIVHNHIHTGVVEALHQGRQVVHQEGGVRFDGWDETFLNSEVDYDASCNKPAPPSLAQRLGFLDFIYSKKARIEGASCRLLPRGHGQLNMINPC